MKTSSNKKHWFKRKSYGWGWTPSSWQGWLALLIYLLLILLIIRIAIDLIAFFLVIATVILIVICFIKGEKPKWQWGEDKKD